MNAEQRQVERKKLVQHRKDLINLFIKNKADINIKDNNNKTLFDHCLENSNYELLDLFTSLSSFNTQPELLITFACLIYNPELKKIFDNLLKNSKLNEELLNRRNSLGLTLFLYYLNSFLLIAKKSYNEIYDYIEFKAKELTNENIEVNKHNLQITYDKYINNNYKNDHSSHYFGSRTVYL